MGEVFPVAVGFTIPLVSKHLQFILIEQLVGDFQDGRMRPERRKERKKQTRKLERFNHNKTILNLR